MTDSQVSHQWQRTRCSLLKRVSNRARHQVAFDDFVEQFLSGEARDKFALNGFARHDHVERSFNADHARQALRAACAGDQTELDFGQRDAGAGGGHAIVATERELEATAHGHAVDCSNDGFC